MDSTDIAPYVSLFAIAKQNLGIIIPSATVVVGGVFALAWSNRTAYGRLESLAFNFGAMALLAVTVFSVVQMLASLPFTENYAVELIGETDLEAAHRTAGYLLERIKNARFCVDLIVFSSSLAFLVACVFWVARHLFIDGYDLPTDEAE